MKTTFLTGFLCAFSLISYAQTEKEVDEMPVPKGGMEAYYKHIMSNIKYPKEARKAGVEGRVYVKGVVTTEGVLENIEVVKGIGHGCNEQAAEAVKGIEWTPGEKNGKIVATEITIPVEFKLGKDDKEG